MLNNFLVVKTDAGRREFVYLRTDSDACLTSLRGTMHR